MHREGIVGLGKPEAMEVPEDTVRIAKAAFRKGNPYLRMRDAFGVVFAGGNWEDLFKYVGRPAESPGLVALVTVFQFCEGLTDRQAADAVRGRIDWKYALALGMTDEGFDHTVLTEFRSRIVAHGAEERILRDLLARLQEAGLLEGKRVQRADSTRVLAAIREVNRLELVAATLRHVLEVLAVANPAWLRARVPANWAERYGPRLEEYRMPKEAKERMAVVESIGQDGWMLLEALRTDEHAPDGIAAVDTMRRIWAQQYRLDETPIRWRAQDDLPAAAELIQSPFDVDARWSYKRSETWTGYKVHFTETCDQANPRLITDVQTTAATTPDVEVLESIQESLVAQDLVPEQLVVDAGYVSAGHLVKAAQRGIFLVGPTRDDTSWQARSPDALGLTAFKIDWDHRSVTCPQGHQSKVWSKSKSDHGLDVIQVTFAKENCCECPVRLSCTRGQSRRLKLRTQTAHQALESARQFQHSSAFRESYRLRAGVEAAFSQAVRGFDLRRSPYLGLAKTRLHNTIVATAINFTRAAAWLAGDRPRSHRPSLLRAVLGTVT